jgi:hypothetical protein
LLAQQFIGATLLLKNRSALGARLLGNRFDKYIALAHGTDDPSE